MTRTSDTPFTPTTIAGIAGILGETNGGLTGSEIGHLLAQAQIPDPLAQANASDPRVAAGEVYFAMSKRDRIQTALLKHQRSKGNGRPVVGFLHQAMNPGRYTGEQSLFEDRQQRLNELLSFESLRIGDDGRCHPSQTAKTLSEAARLAGRLTSELRRRDTHPEVLKYCTEEVLAKNTFHAALEACKGIAERIRCESGMPTDGRVLFEAAFACRKAIPKLQINPLLSESDLAEQTGFMNLLIGLFGMYRNPTAHGPRVVRQAERPITEAQLLELFTTISMIHHTLDCRP